MSAFAVTIQTETASLVWDMARPEDRSVLLFTLWEILSLPEATFGNGPTPILSFQEFSR